MPVINRRYKLSAAAEPPSLSKRRTRSWENSNNCRMLTRSITNKSKEKYEGAKAHTKMDYRRDSSSAVTGVHRGIYRLLEIDKRLWPRCGSDESHEGYCLLRLRFGEP